MSTAARAEATPTRRLSVSRTGTDSAIVPTSAATPPQARATASGTAGRASIQYARPASGAAENRKPSVPNHVLAAFQGSGRRPKSIPSSVADPSPKASTTRTTDASSG